MTVLWHHRRAAIRAAVRIGRGPARARGDRAPTWSSASPRRA